MWSMIQDQLVAYDIRKASQVNRFSSVYLQELIYETNMAAPAAVAASRVQLQC